MLQMAAPVNPFANHLEASTDPTGEHRYWNVSYSQFSTPT